VSAIFILFTNELNDKNVIIILVVMITKSVD